MYICTKTSYILNVIRTATKTNNVTIAKVYLLHALRFLSCTWNTTSILYERKQIEETRTSTNRPRGVWNVPKSGQQD